MKITFLIAGTRGDVQPFVALALGLVRRGHQVCFAAPRGFGDMVAHSGARYCALSVDYEELFNSEEGRRWFNVGSLYKVFGMLADFDRRFRPQVHTEMLACCEGTEALISNLVLENSTACIAEKLKLPLLLGYTLPLMPTGDFPSLMVSQARLPLRSLNRLTHALFETIYWTTQRNLIHAWRAKLGLPPTSGAPRHELWRRGVPILHAYSSHVVPRPADWSASTFITGFWIMPQEVGQQAGGTPTRELIRWLEAGPAPVYLGCWRLPVLDIAKMLRMATEAAATAGVRIVIGANWTAQDLAGLTVPDSVFITGSVDHEWLFRRCSATVHHGGAGTTAATMRAGLPMVVCPIYADQPFWASRAKALGVGCSVPFQALTSERLTQALRQVQDSGMRARAAQLSAALMQEDGVATAVRLIEERLPGAPLLG